MRCHGFVNMYTAGKFHRVNKPGACNVHPGDVYLTEHDAVANIDPAAGYVTTTHIAWDQADPPQRVPDDAVPIPLSVTRRQYEQPTKETT